MKLNLRGSHAESLTIDGSRNLYRVGASLGQKCDLLYAVPFIKANPVNASTDSAANALYSMKVTVQSQNAALPTTPGYYDNVSGANGMVEFTDGLASTDFLLARIGLQFKVLKIDARAGAQGTAQDSYENRVYATSFAVLRMLDTEFAQGAGGAAPQKIVGLSTLAGNALPAADIEIAARTLMANVTPNGTGAGDGIDCYFGGPGVMQRLIATPSGQRGMSGWKVDRRTGRFLYHYMGIPYYRTNTGNDSVSGPLYGANLGGTGLNIVHTDGDADSFGLTVDEEDMSGNRAQRVVSVHGAYALVLWETAGLKKCTGV